MGFQVWIGPEVTDPVTMVTKLCQSRSRSDSESVIYARNGPRAGRRARLGWRSRPYYSGCGIRLFTSNALANGIMMRGGNDKLLVNLIILSLSSLRLLRLVDYGRAGSALLHNLNWPARGPGPLRCR